jgi:hypothetical protein
MKADEIVRTGYAALTSRGYTADSIKQLATEKGKTEIQVMDDLMCSVVHDYVQFLCKTCFKGGLPKDRIYTHLTGIQTLPESSIPATLHGDGRLLPLWTVVNRYSRPGLTMMDGCYDANVAAASFKKLKRSEWGAAEVEFGASTRNEDGAVKRFDLFEQLGVKLICIYGWWEASSSPFSVKGSGAVAGMRRWLMEPQAKR